MKKLVLVIGLGLVAVAVAGMVKPHGRQRSHAQARPGVQASQACQAGDRKLRFSLNGATHDALLHVPSGAHGRLPLVLAFHGFKNGARVVATYYGLSALADQGKQFAVLYPEASRNTFWQLPPGQEEDVDAIQALLTRVQRGPCFDSSRVYATGASNGGGFTARLGCEMADRLAAIAPVAGGYSPLGPCKPSRPLPVLEIHGTRDQVVPYGGKGPNGDGSVANFLGEWTDLDGCVGGPAKSTPARGVTQLAWEHCAGGAVVEHLRLATTPHGWPGGGGDPTARIDGARTVWAFLSRFKRS